MDVNPDGRSVAADSHSDASSRSFLLSFGRTSAAPDPTARTARIAASRESRSTALLKSGVHFVRSGASAGRTRVADGATLGIRHARNHGVGAQPGDRKPVAVLARPISG